MMKRNVVLYLFIYLSTLVGITSPSFADTQPDTADVLPKGIFRVTGEGNYYLPIDKRYDPDGNLEDIAADLNADLNSSVFSGLSAVESTFGLAAGTGTVGQSIVSFKYHLFDYALNVAYGLTDKLSVGLRLPFFYNGNTVDARVDTSNATVGKSAIGAGFGAPLVPLPGSGAAAPDPFGDAVPLTTDDVQTILGPGLDVDGNGTIDIAGFGFKRIESRNETGISDIEAGFRYQYEKNKYSQHAFTGAVRFPTGKVDDPDDLADLAFGDGAYAILFRLNNDYVVSNLWKETNQSDAKGGVAGFTREPGDLVFNGTFKVDIVIPTKKILRVPNSANEPLTANKDNVQIDIGDKFEWEVAGNYTVSKGLTFTGLYRYALKLHDIVSGTRGFAYEALEQESRRTEQVIVVGLSYTTLPLYLEKKFSFPLTAAFFYRNRVAGSGNVLRSQYFHLQLGVLF